MRALILALLFVSGSVFAADATLTWDAVTLDVSGAPVSGVTYNVYTSSGPMSPVLAKGLTGTSYVIKNLVSGCWYVTATVGALESDAPASVCKVVNSKPAKPSGLALSK